MKESNQNKPIRNGRTIGNATPKNPKSPSTSTKPRSINEGKGLGKPTPK